MALALAGALLAPASSLALVCGDGELDATEACDDGNLAAGDCCSPLCEIEPAGTECRASTGPCDPAEACNGQTGGCPNDLNLPDTDADAVCDEDDLCPSVVDPDQLDTDGDRLGDACDPCTTVDGVVIERAKVTLSNLGDPADDDKIGIRGIATIRPMPPLDPIANGLLIQMVDGLGGTALDVTLPNRAIDPVSKTGWRERSAGRTWRYKGGRNAVGGIDRAILKVDAQDPSIVRFTIVGRKGSYTRPAAAPVTLSVGLRGPIAAPGQCPQIEYQEEGPGPRCLALNAGAKFVCR